MNDKEQQVGHRSSLRQYIHEREREANSHRQQMIPISMTLRSSSTIGEQTAVHHPNPSLDSMMIDRKRSMPDQHDQVSEALVFPNASLHQRSPRRVNELDMTSNPQVSNQKISLHALPSNGDPYSFTITNCTRLPTLKCPPNSLRLCIHSYHPLSQHKRRSSITFPAITYHETISPISISPRSTLTPGCIRLTNVGSSTVAKATLIPKLDFIPDTEPKPFMSHTKSELHAFSSSCHMPSPSLRATNAILDSKQRTGNISPAHSDSSIESSTSTCSSDDHHQHHHHHPTNLSLFHYHRHSQLSSRSFRERENYEQLIDLAEKLSDPNRSNKINIDQFASYRYKSRPSDTSSLVSSKQTACVICMSQFKHGQHLRVLPCQHEYHTKCLARWFTMNSSCPICRRDFFVLD